MSNKLSEINDKLAELLKKGWALSNEDLFNLGVEFGKELAKNNIETYRAPVWSELEQSNTKELEIRKAVERIEDFIATLVKLSVTAHMQDGATWSIAKGGGYGLDKFSDEIVEKYNVQVSGCDMESYGGEFLVTFNVEGELADLFDKHNIYKEFTVRIYNDNGEEEQTLYDIKKVDGYIDDVRSYVRNSNEWELEKYIDFLHEISKPYLFLITKNIL